jgi:hypothetical protein
VSGIGGGCGDLEDRNVFWSEYSFVNNHASRTSFDLFCIWFLAARRWRDQISHQKSSPSSRLSIPAR